MKRLNLLAVVLMVLIASANNVWSQSRTQADSLETDVAKRESIDGAALHSKAARNVSANQQVVLELADGNRMLAHVYRSVEVYHLVDAFGDPIEDSLLTEVVAIMVKKEEQIAAGILTGGAVGAVIGAVIGDEGANNYNERQRKSDALFKVQVDNSGYSMFMGCIGAGIGGLLGGLVGAAAKGEKRHNCEKMSLEQKWILLKQMVH